MIKGICDWAVGKNINIKELNLNTEDNEQQLNGNDMLKNKCEIPNEEYKNCFQTLAMCNVCAVCKLFLISNNLFSDYKIHGIRKWFGRKLNRFIKCLSKI